MAVNKEVPYAEFGERLMELRKKANMTRAELGEICGVAPSTIVNYERGTRIPYADTAVKMAQHFNLSVPELLGMEDPSLVMAQEEAMDQMRSINGKKGAERLQRVYSEAASLAGGDLSDDQLLEFSMEMQKMALLAQQRLTERYSNKKFQGTVDRKAEQTAAAVEAIDNAISAMVDDDASDLIADQDD